MTAPTFSLARSRRGRRNGIGLTSLIDVIFLLVIFYMLVSQFTDLRIVPIAVSNSGNPSVSQDILVIRILSDSNLSFNGDIIPETEIDERLALTSPSPQTIVSVQVGDQVALQRAIFVLDAVRATGISQISLSRGGPHHEN